MLLVLGFMITSGLGLAVAGILMSPTSVEARRRARTLALIRTVSVEAATAIADLRKRPPPIPTHPPERDFDVFYLRNRAGLYSLVPKWKSSSHEDYVRDAWGRPLVLHAWSWPPRPPRDGFYSVGPNGIDEEGEGDDILVDVADVASGG